jgi:hypothetical protein
MKHRPSRTHRYARARRGTALSVALVAIFVFSVAGLGLVSRIRTSVHDVRILTDSSVAFNIAESGAERGLLWLHDQGDPPNGTAPRTIYLNQPLGQGTYTVTIDPDDRNPTSDLSSYLITSVGVAGTRQETVKLLAQAKSMASYAHFTSYQNPNLWWVGGVQFDGPVHSNNRDGVLVNINWQASNKPMFLDRVTMVAPSINYAPRPPETDEEYRRIFKDGPAGLSLSSFDVKLPTNSNKQQALAWGWPTDFPTTDSVSIPANGTTARGGIYISGDAGVEFSLNKNKAWQDITITQGGDKYQVTIKRDLGVTTISKNGAAATTYTGTTNGLIYSSGNITSLKGELADSVVSGDEIVSRNAYTVVADMAAGKEVTITDNITYKTTPDKDKAWNDKKNLDAAALGIMAKNICIDGDVTPQNLEVDASLLAGTEGDTTGSVYVKDYLKRTPPGKFRNVGGLVHVRAGIMGTFNGSTGVISTGYLKDISYDYRFRKNPPPFFASSNSYGRISWQSTGGAAVN